MAILIEDGQLERTVMELAAKAGESVDRSILSAVTERLQRISRRTPEELLARLTEITGELLPQSEADHGSAHETFGYNELGISTDGDRPIRSRSNRAQ